MGGSYEEKISGYRIHINNGDVHLHDDDSNFKFEMDSKEFKNDIKDALNQFKSNEGLIEIEGRGKNSLCLIKKGRSLSMFLRDSSSVKSKLQSFLKKC